MTSHSGLSGLPILSGYLSGALILGLPAHPLQAATYYVNPETGSDAFPPTGAQNPSTPWKTLTHAWSTLQPGDTLSLQAGTYSDLIEGGLESFPLTLKPGIHLQGAGHSLTRLEAPSDVPLFEQAEPMAEHFWLTGLSLDHPGPTGSSLNTALLLHLELGPTLLGLDDISLGSGSDSGITLEATGAIGADSLLDLTVSNSTFSGTRGIAGTLDGLDGQIALSITLTDTLFEVAESGLAVSQVDGSGRYSLDLLTTGCTFVGGDIGIQSVHQATGGMGSEQWWIADSQFSFLQTHALELTLDEVSIPIDETHAVSLTVHGNQFSDGGDQDVITTLRQLSGGNLNVTSQVTGNTFSRCGTGAVALHTHDLTLASAQLDTTVTDNTIGLGSVGVSGISLLQEGWSGGEASITQTLTGNTITGAAESALGLTLSNFADMTLGYTNEVSGNTLEDLGRYGAALNTLVLDSVDATLTWTLSNNTIAHSEASGIRFLAQSFIGAASSQLDVAISDNHLRQVGLGDPMPAISQSLYVLNGPLTLALDSTISGNTISGAGGDGVLVSHAMSSSAAEQFTDQTVITDNTLETIEKNGIHLRHSYILGHGLVELGSAVAGNQITQTGDAGILTVAQNLQNADLLGYSLNVFNNLLMQTDTGVASRINGINAVQNLSLELDFLGNRVEEIVPSGQRGLDVTMLSLGTTNGDLGMRVSGNTVVNKGGEGIAISLESQEVLSSNLVEIKDNVLTGSAVGLSLSSQNYLAPHIRVSGNTIQESDTYAVWLQAPLSSPGTTPDGTLYADLGGGSLGSPGNNTLQGTTSGKELRIDTTSSSAVLTAQSNAWPETDDAHIQTRITSSGAHVDASHPLSTPPEPSANASLSVLLLQDEGLEGPSPGDTLRLTALLESTGSIGCAAGFFSLTLPTGMILVPDTSQVSQGAILRQDGDALWAGLYWPGAGQNILVQTDVQVTGSDCAPLELQGVFWCDQLGDVPTDDPSTPAEHGDSTLIPLTTQSVYVDADQDGQGDASTGVSACSASLPEGTSTVAGDCDDLSPTVYTGGIEVCDGLDNDCDGTPDLRADGSSPGQPWYQDSDKDGYGVYSIYIVSCTKPDAYSALPGDCDDTSAQSSPAAPETCNGQDDDCNGIPDDGFSMTLLYLDQDQDDYGDSSQALESCQTSLSGYSSQGGDCADTQPDIHPGATDVCDLVDNDCNQQVDDGPAPTLSLDADDDGYGTEEVQISACPNSVEGFVETTGDCDDTQPDIHPASDELCNGLDDDCDTQVDEDFELTPWYVDTDGDGFGVETSAMFACVAPADTVATAGDCDDQNNLVYPGALERCDGIDNACDGTAEALEACPPEATPLPESLAIVGNGLSCSVGGANPSSSEHSLPAGAILLAALGWLHRRKTSAP